MIGNGIDDGKGNSPSSLVPLFPCSLLPVGYACISDLRVGQPAGRGHPAMHARHSMITDQQQRAIAFLAASVRPHGARRWQEPGILAALAKVSHLNAAEVALAAIRAAADRNAETPGVIPSNGPHWSEGSFTPAWEPDHTPKHLRCSACSLPKPKCEATWSLPAHRDENGDPDHAFTPSTVDNKRPADAMAAIVQEAKARLEQTKPPPPEPERQPDPKVQAIRAELASTTNHHQEPQP